jgi:uncharacterized protein YjbJ (UPF0337 family)
MNWDRIEGQWKQRRGKAVHHWGKVMNDELAAISGKYEELVGRLQENYGIAKEDAKGKTAEFKKGIEKLKKSNASLMKLQNSLNATKKKSKKVVSKAKAKMKK